MRSFSIPNWGIQYQVDEPDLVTLIRLARELAGASRELGAILGIHRNTITNWAAGRYIPDREKVQVLMSWVRLQLQRKAAEVSSPGKSA
jgi:ribosome-binding protein aMBF1 (putative translation factor)